MPMNSDDAGKFLAMLKLLVGFIVTLFAVGSLTASLPASLELGVITNQLVGNLIGLIIGLLLLVDGYLGAKKRKEKQEADPAATDQRP